ncbi:phosphoserine phosphatase [Rhagoletis pomonella]|uniref:phosphoserine phosphatase n=1 Tax=Rhagoletis pomonella TaxID=28610 RepID=UPI00177BD5F6|nr:phosphoserine phosphatase [Rhagoletis pomonella]
MNRVAMGSVRVARSGNLLNDAYVAAPQSAMATSNVNVSHNNNNQLNLSTKAPLINRNLTPVADSDALKTSKNPQLAAEIVKQSNVVCFDVDSTVICEEGIDELADFCGKGSEVARVTKEAMGGAMTFQDALNIRLNIIKPSQKQIIDFLKQRPHTLTKNIRSLVDKFKSEGKEIYLISGGFHCLIDPIADDLGIPRDHVFANKLMFYFNGDYASFDTSQPTSKSGGKAEAVSIIKRSYPSANITMIGDGATDLEASPPANNVIGFGGNVLRDEVHKRAQYYIMDFAELM